MGSLDTHSRALRNTQVARIHAEESQWLRDGQRWVPQVSDMRPRYFWAQGCLGRMCGNSGKLTGCQESQEKVSFPEFPHILPKHP